MSILTGEMKAMDETITPDQAIKILKNASEALSHASYCGITGHRVNHHEITTAWDPLRALIKQVAPDNIIAVPGDKEWIAPTLVIERAVVAGVAAYQEGNG